MKESTKNNLMLVSLASDPRIPPETMGYISDLQDENISDSVRADRIAQLKKYVPELERMMG